MKQNLMARCFGILLFLVSGFFFGSKQPVQAVQVGNIPVDVQTVLPPQQSSQVKDYFDIAPEQGQTTTIGLKLENLSKQKQSLRIRVANGSTTFQGELEYAPNAGVKDHSLKYPLNKLVNPSSQKVELAPRETRTVNFTVQTPAAPYNGIVLGSLFIDSPRTEKSAVAKAKKSKVEIVNTYSMYLAVVLRLNNWTQVQPDFQLNTVAPALILNNPGIQANLQNFKPAMINNKELKIKAYVTRRNSTKKIKLHNLDASFAPNSTLRYPVSWGKSQMVPGNYTLYMNMVYHDQQWHLKRNFTITAKVANKLNQANQARPNYTWLWILLAVLFVILLTVFITYIYKRGQRQGAAKANRGRSRRKR
ncbi:DUF916 and DUF3324 domain-containing protein [Agrilactobacillus fermenti]|uniref:DUF916 and DUF3324 domain-containing protein n=1 Tax=Agrilactobacillus fermenti TaxID=2586909 RepID=UPI001E388B90|nr:DUF916 and DUF3324 domain-containing protein [Agrilactobacillus fermenti]MCD2256944.1 DUF916 and DUF3324 domain-containing protein [Agrilactobacillus fermenti]